MGSRSHAQTNSAQNSDATHLQNQTPSRPFSTQPQTEFAAIDQQELPDVQTQLESAKQFGHRFTGAVNSDSNTASKPSPLPFIQPKLTIGAPGDKYEQEADRVAAQVVNQIQASKLQPAEQAQDIQRSSVPEEEEELQMLPDISRVQRSSAPEEEELQMSSMVQRSSGGETATPDIEAEIDQARSGGQSLDESIRQPMEQSFKADFSGVRVHTDAQADGLNRSLLSRAFTTNQDIFFKRGEYQPNSKNGQELIAHELTHVVQQNSAAVQRKETKIQRKAANNLQISQVSAPSGVLQRDYYLYAGQGVNVTFNMEEKFQGVVTTGVATCVAVALDATYQEQRALSLAHFDENTITTTTLPKMYESIIKALKIGDINSVSEGAIQITYHLGGGADGYLKKLMPKVSDFLGKQAAVTSVQGSLYDTDSKDKNSKGNKDTAFKIDKEKGFGKSSNSFNLQEENFDGGGHYVDLMYMVYDSAEAYKALLATLEKSQLLDVEQDEYKDHGAEHYKELERCVSDAKKMKEDPKAAIENLEKYIGQLKQKKNQTRKKLDRIVIAKNDPEETKKSKKEDKDKCKEKIEELDLKIKNVENSIDAEKKKLELVKSD